MFDYIVVLDSHEKISSSDVMIIVVPFLISIFVYILVFNRNNTLP